MKLWTDFYRKSLKHLTSRIRLSTSLYLKTYWLWGFLNRKNTTKSTTSNVLAFRLLFDSKEPLLHKGKLLQKDISENFYIYFSDVLLEVCNISKKKDPWRSQKNKTSFTFCYCTRLPNWYQADKIFAYSYS